MRCCLASLDDAPTDPMEGDTFLCHYCHDDYGMVFRDDAWQWAMPL